MRQPSSGDRRSRAFPWRRAIGALTLAGCALGWGAPSAAAAPPAAGADAATDAEARIALEAFQEASRGRREAADRIQAVRDLARCVHAKVADRLLRLVATESEGAVLAAVYEGLARQGPSVARVAGRLATRLEEEAEAARERLAKGDGGFRLDPRTGNADLSSPEGRERLRTARERATANAALLRSLAALGWKPGRSPPDLTPFLQDASDELVIEVLGTLGAWKVVAALPAVLELYRMYPDASEWATGAVVDLAGTNATARAKWMVTFGHPDKQRARPQVVEALHRMLVAVTGRDFDSPDALAQHLARDDGKTRLAAGRREG